VIIMFTTGSLGYKLCPYPCSFVGLEMVVVGSSCLSPDPTSAYNHLPPQTSVARHDIMQRIGWSFPIVDGPNVRIQLPMKHPSSSSNKAEKIA